MYKKGQNRLFFLRKLKSFDVCNHMLHIFYQSVVASVLLFGAVCWGNSMTVRDSNRLDKLIRRCVSVMGGRVESVGSMVERRMRSMVHAILNNNSHPLHETLAAQRSSRSNRLLSLRC